MRNVFVTIRSTGGFLHSTEKVNKIILMANYVLVWLMDQAIAFLLRYIHTYFSSPRFLKS